MKELNRKTTNPKFLNITVNTVRLQWTSPTNFNEREIGTFTCEYAYKGCLLLVCLKPTMK